MRKTGKFRKALAVSALAGMLWAMPAFTSYAAVGPGGAIATGVDVSKHNGAVNWQAAAAAGVKFTFIKAGSTKSGMDPFFQANIQNANQAGIKTGVYIYSYATNVEQTIQEANLLLGWINDQTVTYPVVYDVEDAVHRGKSREELAAMANAFCATVEAAGYYPMVYSSKNWFEGRIGDVGYDKWVAQYNDSCQYGGNISFWQSTSSASISGFNGRVDFNYQYKDFSGLIIPEGFLEKNGNVRFYRNWRMQRGWVDYTDTRYHLDDAGNLQKGMWFSDPQGTCYLTPQDGQIARGQYNAEGQDYYFTQEGYKATGWIVLGEQRYFYDPAGNGVMKREWYSDESGQYFYLDPADGHMLTGTATIQEKNYFFGPDGVRFGGIRAIPEGAWYYDPATGEMVIGWINTGGQTYYAGADGRLVVGLNTVDNQSYYFDANGILLKDQVVDVAGVPYVLDAQGVAAIQPPPEPEPQPEVPGTLTPEAAPAQ